MKLLLDQGLPHSTGSILRHDGVDAIHVGDLGMWAASDEAIIDYARANGYCIVTLDAAFHSLIAAASAGGPSVIRLRVQRLRALDAARLVQAVIERVAHELSSGCFITATEDAIRVRALPIRRVR